MPRRLGEYEDRSFRATDDEAGDSAARHPASLDRRHHRSLSHWEGSITSPERGSILTDELERSSPSSRTQGDISARLDTDTDPNLLRPLQSSFAEFRARRARRDAAEAEGLVESVGSYPASPQASRDTLSSQDTDDWVEVDLDRGPIWTTTHRASYAVAASALTSATTSVRGAINSGASSSQSNGTRARTDSKFKTRTSYSAHSVSLSPPCTSPDLDAMTLVEETRREMERLRNDSNATVDELIASCVRYREAKKRAGVDESMSTSGYLSSSDGTPMKQSELVLPILSFGPLIPPSRAHQPFRSSQINPPNPPNPPSQPSQGQESHTSLSTAPSTSGPGRRSSGGTGSREFRKSPLRQVMSADGNDDGEADEQSTGDLGFSAARH